MGVNDQLHTDIYMAAMQEKARRRLEELRKQFPHAPTMQEEVDATVEFKKAASLVRQVFDHHARLRLMTLAGGKEGAMLHELVPDWEAVTFAAKLLRYIALSARYELRAFTPYQRLARDEREARHREVLSRWPVLGFSSS